MKLLVTLIAALALAHNANAAEKFLEEMTAKALTAGEPAAVAKALEREVYRGNVVAALELGRMYRDGKGIPADHAKARKMLNRAAEADEIRLFYKLGVPEAKYSLAVMLRDGIGGKPDPSGARAWFEEAAELGHAQSQRTLAQMYFNGTGVTRNPERAFIWSSIAANSLTALEKEEMEQIRSLAQKQLEPQQLARAGNLVSTWKPKPS